jgi:hypothetical protein
MARSNAIFKEKVTTHDCVVVQDLSILSFFPQEKDMHPQRILAEIQIDKSKSWDFFLMGLLKRTINFVGGGVMQEHRSTSAVCQHSSSSTCIQQGERRQPSHFPLIFKFQM